MSPDDASGAVDSILDTGSLDGVAVDPEFRDLLCRISRGEITADEAMEIRELRSENG